MSSVPFVCIGAKNNLLSDLCEIRSQILVGLNDIELINGWPDSYLTENETSVWTSVTILNILLSQNIIPNNFNQIIDYVESEKKVVNNNVGWFLGERFEPYISIYVTSEVLSLMVRLNKTNSCEAISNTIQLSQNTDGGWGVCPDDVESKVRPTAAALNSLLDCYEHPGANCFIDENILVSGIKWLYSAQIDNENDHGWNIFQNCPPSSVSSTAYALLTLLRASAINEKLGYHKEQIRRGLHTLLSLGKNGFWQGDIEDVAIRINGKYVSRHATGGLGTLTVINTIIKAINKELIPIDNNYLYAGINNLIHRSKKYQQYKGLWITPSDQGGSPLIWNSAYALKTISEIQNYYIYMLGKNYIDFSIYKEMSKRARFWKTLALSLLISIIGTYLIYFLSIRQIMPSFSNFNPFTQGVILMILSITSQELYRYFTVKFSQLKEERVKATIYPTK